MQHYFFWTGTVITLHASLQKCRSNLKILCTWPLLPRFPMVWLSLNIKILWIFHKQFHPRYRFYFMILGRELPKARARLHNVLWKSLSMQRKWHNSGISVGQKKLPVPIECEDCRDWNGTTVSWNIIVMYLVHLSRFFLCQRTIGSLAELCFFQKDKVGHFMFSGTEIGNMHD